ncbi:MAG TPA: anti-sigma factor [Puia sp.]
MTPQEYILSGIVESYVLGLASPEDSAEFDRMCDAHGEVRAARNAFELQLEQTLIQQKKEPPRGLKSRIFSEIGMEKDEQSPRIPLNKPALVPRKGFARYVAAASLILLVGSVMLNLYLLNQYKKSIAQFKELVVTQTQVAGDNQILQTKLESYENALSLMKNPLMAIVKMPGTATGPAPSSMATVYWNTESKEVYLLVNQLPIPVSDKQYQLWAIVDGHPKDAGIFVMNGGTSFVKLKTIPKAEAFAITLEKKGGSTTPTMDAMYVMGKVTG